jgi:hypothetical protein
MANECRIEFYFRKEELEKLIAANPKAKGIIISQEIVREKPRGTLQAVNIAHIKATVYPAKKAAAKKAMTAGPVDDGSIDGCPYPPGCQP